MLTINLRSITVALYICAGLLLGVGYRDEAYGQVQQQREEKGVLDPITTKTDLYPVDADARKEIEAASKRATNEKKRVILIFGANWCYDCHVLDRALHEGAAGKLVKDSFLLVHVDIGEGDKNTALAKKYKIPIEKGVPAVAVLESDGNLVYSSGAGEFESARRMMKKDLFAFLTQWKQQPK
jgi:thiol:disulfide interchange protein